MPSGGELLLVGGDYGSLRLEGQWADDSPLTIRSLDPEAPARIQELMVINSSNIVFEGLVFDYRFSAGDVYYTRPFQIVQSQNIKVGACLFDGDLAGPGTDVTEGFATAFGLGLRGAQNLSIIGNEFRRFGRALICDDIEGLTIQGNDFHALRSDGLNCVAVRNVAIEGNHIHDFARDIESGDHADMIQFWTNRAVAPTRNVRIRANLINAGRGGWSQSIFIRNEMVDQGLAGEEMFYRNIEISNNVILNAHLHGVAVGETDGLLISNNTMVHNTEALGQGDPAPLWVPRIRVNEAARNVVIARNVTAEVMGYEAQTDWQVRDNLLVQNRARGEPGFYLTAFGPASITDTTRPGSFAARVGGPLDGTGVGATWLDAGTTRPPRLF